MTRISIPDLTYNAIEVTPEVQITKRAFKHDIVVSSERPLSSFLMNIEGQLVTVDYYSQVLGSSEELSAPEIDQEAIYQQYRLIKGLELKFDGQLARSTRAEDQQMDVNGSAYVFGYLKPNKGDAFLMDLGEGLGGRFTVTEVTQEYLQKETIYRINFQLAHMLDEDDFKNMQRKVVETLHFVKDFMLYGQSPLLTDGDFVKLTNAKLTFKTVLSSFMDEFYSIRFSTIVPPVESFLGLYDSFAVQAFLQVMDMTDDRRVPTVKVYNTSEFDFLYDTSIWSVLIRPEYFKEKQIWVRAERASVNQLNINPSYNSLRYSSFNNFIKPLGVNNNVDDYSGYSGRSVVGYFANANGGSIMNADGNALGTDGERYYSCYRKNYYSINHLSMFPYDPRNLLSYIEDWQCRKPCSEEELQCEDTCGDYTDGYIFDDKFWEATELRDPFLALVKTHLTGGIVDTIRILELLSMRLSWSRMDRFYKTLILLIILKSSIRKL